MAVIRNKGKRSVFEPVVGADLISILEKKRPDLAERAKNPSAKMKVAMNLFELRRKEGLTQKEAAEKSGIPIATYQRIEEAQPTSNAKIDVIEKLAKAFKVDLTYFFKPIKL